MPSLEGRALSAHPMTGDVALIHSYVYDKYMRDGAICEEGSVTVKLRSRRAADGGG